MNFRTNLLAVFILMAGCINLLTAQRAPQVITMLNGNRFVGEIASVTAFSAEQPNPWNVARIALVDDGLRRVFFHKNLDKIGNITPLGNDHPLANPTEFEIIQKNFDGRSDGFGSTTFEPFNEFGHRLMHVFDGQGNRTFAQGITKLNPHWCEVKTLKDPDGVKMRDWTMKIATSTVPPEVLRNLMIGMIKDRNNPAEYLTIVDFFRESQQYNLALNELAFIGERFPSMKEKLDNQIKAVRLAQARQQLRQVENWIEVGQPQLASDMLRAFDRSGIATEILVEMGNIQRQLEDTDFRIEGIRKPIVNLIDEVLREPEDAKLEAGQIPMLERFKAELNTELNRETVARLDAFRQFQNDGQMSMLQKLSIALSGWFTGTANSTENFAVSQSFFTIRDLVKQYLVSNSNQQRQTILKELEKYEGGEPKYLAPLIANMLPPLAPDLSIARPDQPLEFEVQVSLPKAAANAGGTKKQAFKYYVQLPPEYNPYRKYPCVIVLPGDKNIKRQLNIWCGPFNPTLNVRVGQAMRNGYIVVVCDWKEPGQFEYKYSAREHQTIMAAYRKVLKQFAIDTDRVFLTGHHFGADAAYDIGIAHPEHWAGIVGVSGRVAKFPDLYREHKHNQLPIYCVVGEKDLDSKVASQDAWNLWLTRKSLFDCTVVEYTGRSNELFVEEIIEIFKWMRGYRRQLPDRNGFEFVGKIRRPWDNYFWFFELHGFPLEKGVVPQFFGPKFPRALEVKAELKSNQVNRFFVSPANQGAGLTLWLSPEFVDFTKRFNVSGRGDFKDFVSPSREILLEDVRKRGDRQHPYWANVRCVGKSWEANVARYPN